MNILPCPIGWRSWRTGKRAVSWFPFRSCRAALPAAVANAQDAKKAWLEAAIADGVMIQEPDSLEKYSGQFKLRMPRSLHRALAEHSQQEGISMNQYCVYLLAKNDALHAG